MTIKIIISVAVMLVGLSVAIVDVTVSVAIIIQLEVFAALMQVTGKHLKAFYQVCILLLL